MVINPELFPLSSEKAKDVSEILNSALFSVNPRMVTNHSLQKLILGEVFSGFSRVGLVSIGKAAVPMAMAAEDLFHDRIGSGVVVTKVFPADLEGFPSKFCLLTGSHPVPDSKSEAAGNEVLNYLAGFGENEAVLFLISGGASALVTHPVFAITLEDLMNVTQVLLNCGASIDEINTVRKHLDECKGGGMAHAAYPAASISLILSDVPGNQLDVIASGPTLPDSTTFDDAMAVFEKFNLNDDIPESVFAYFSDGIQGIVADTPKPGNAAFKDNRAEVIASVDQAMSAAKKRAEELGYQADLYFPLLRGEAFEQGSYLAQFLKQQAKLKKPASPPKCWICGGETTVTIQGTGEGGRNQELALAAVAGLAEVPGAVLVAFATDGEDGQSPAAGAIVTSATLTQSQEKRLNPADYLENNDSYKFFQALGASIVTGSTGTNVNDLVLLFLD